MVEIEYTETDKNNNTEKHISCDFSCDECERNEFKHNDKNGKNFFLCVHCGAIYEIEELKEK